MCLLGQEAMIQGAADPGAMSLALCQADHLPSKNIHAAEYEERHSRPHQSLENSHVLSSVLRLS